MLNTSQNQEGQFGFLDMLAIIGFALQMANYQENARQSSNDDLVKEMRHQDRVYFEKIIKQNEKTIELLSERQ